MRTWMVFLCAGALLLGSDVAMRAALSAAQVFVEGVLPALFPMMVLGRLLKAERSRHSQVIFGWLGGSPAAAQRAAGLMGRVSAEEMDALLCMTGVMSPMFFTGTLSRWTGEPGLCKGLLAVHWVSALATAFVWKRLPLSCAREDAQPVQEAQTATLPQAIAQSAQAALGVCGAMMLFSIAAAFLGLWMMGKAQAVMWALLEIGGGAHAVLQAFPQPPYALLCALCSFGGLSIWLQNWLFLQENIRPAKLLGMRALHGAVSYGLASVYLSAFLKIQNLLMT